MYDDYDQDPFETDIFESVEEDVLWNTNSDDDSALFVKSSDEEEDIAPIIDEVLETEDGEDLGALGLHIADDEKTEEEEL